MLIVRVKHPATAERDAEASQALADPDHVRRSRKDPSVLLIYRGSSPRWLCAVARIMRSEGFLITAYPTDATKAGEVLWTRSG